MASISRRRRIAIMGTAILTALGTGLWLVPSSYAGQNSDGTFNISESALDIRASSRSGSRQSVLQRMASWPVANSNSGNVAEVELVILRDDKRTSSDESQGCSSTYVTTRSASAAGKVVLIADGGCNMAQKARIAASNGAAAIIVSFDQATAQAVELSSAMIAIGVSVTNGNRLRTFGASDTVRVVITVAD